MLPVDYRISGQVKVVSYWTDRGATNNGGTNGDIAVWSHHLLCSQQPTRQQTAQAAQQLRTRFYRQLWRERLSRFYVMEQTLNFATVTGISATNPMQLKWVEFQRRAVMPATPATTTFSSPVSTSTSHETPPLQQPANPLQPQAATTPPPPPSRLTANWPSPRRRSLHGSNHN
jgi:hypothetical protein